MVKKRTVLPTATRAAQEGTALLDAEDAVGAKVRISGFEFPSEGRRRNNDSFLETYVGRFFELIRAASAILFWTVF